MSTNYSSIGIAGIGCVGNAVLKSFKKRNLNVVPYDKYKDGGIGKDTDLLSTDIIYLCLPTLYSEELGEYDKKSINSVCTYLKDNNYNGMVVLKSTVEPETSENMAKTYGLKFAHNPEFLSARTSEEDFENQDHIVLGRTSTCTDDDFERLRAFFAHYWPEAQMTLTTSTQSELMKICANTFYAAKVQIFNEYYDLCTKLKVPYQELVDMLLKNKWINPMHTNVPGPDGKLGFGGACLPKDSSALFQELKRRGCIHSVIESVVTENKEWRK